MSFTRFCGRNILSSTLLKKNFSSKTLPLFAKKGEPVKPAQTTAPKNAPKTATTPKKDEGVYTLPDGTRAVIRRPESMSDIKKSIISLTQQEEQIATSSDEAVAIKELRDSYLAKSGFELATDSEGTVTLSKKVDNVGVRVVFDPYETERGESEEEEFEEESEEGKEEDNVSENENEDAKKLTIEVELAFYNKEGKIEGRWIFGGFSGRDNRLYISDMGTCEGEAEPSEIQLQSFPMNDFSEEMQDKIYDLLDELKLDDKLAAFIRQYVLQNASQSSVQFLQRVRKFMSL